jgi:hypothetical protein
MKLSFGLVFSVSSVSLLHRCVQFSNGDGQAAAMACDGRMPLLPQEQDDGVLCVAKSRHRYVWVKSLRI